MSNRDLGIAQLIGGVSVAIEREQAAGIAGAAGNLEIEILTRRVAIDLDRDPSIRRGGKHLVPIGRDSGPR